MLYVNQKERDPLDEFRAVIYKYLKENKLRYSDQRERVLKILYSQSYPVSTEFLVQKLNEQTLGAGYATVSRQLKFFEKLNMLIIIQKAPKGFLLKKSIDDAGIDVDVISFSYKKNL